MNIDEVMSECFYRVLYFGNSILLFCFEVMEHGWLGLITLWALLAAVTLYIYFLNKYKWIMDKQKISYKSIHTEIFAK